MQHLEPSGRGGNFDFDWASLCVCVFLFPGCSLSYLVFPSLPLCFLVAAAGFSGWSSIWSLPNVFILSNSLSSSNVSLEESRHISLLLVRRAGTFLSSRGEQHCMWMVREQEPSFNLLETHCQSFQFHPSIIAMHLLPHVFIRYLLFINWHVVIACIYETQHDNLM